MSIKPATPKAPAFNTRAAVRIREQEEADDQYCKAESAKDEFNLAAPASHTRSKMRWYARQRELQRRQKGVNHVKRRLYNYISRPKIQAVTKHAAIFLNASLEAVLEQTLRASGLYAKRFSTPGLRDRIIPSDIYDGMEQDSELQYVAREYLWPRFLQTNNIA
jgi:hypothetical protein